MSRHNHQICYEKDKSIFLPIKYNLFQLTIFMITIQTVYFLKEIDNII